MQRELQALTLCPGSGQGPLSSPLKGGGRAPKSLCQARGTLGVGGTMGQDSELLDIRTWT